MRTEVDRLETKCRVLDADRWRVERKYQEAVRNTCDWKWEEYESKMDEVLNERVEAAVGGIHMAQADKAVAGRNVKLRRALRKAMELLPPAARFEVQKELDS